MLCATLHAVATPLRGGLTQALGARSDMHMTEFSIARHTTFLSGYLDAVARSITTDSVLCNLSASFVELGNSSGRLKHDRAVLVDNWSIEFGALTDSFLGIDERSRLGFYLVDYICWFRDFTSDAKCYKCAGDTPEPEVAYYLEWPEGVSVLIAASKHHRPAPNNSFKPSPHQGGA